MFQQASAAGERWRWWDFVRTMQERCSARTWNFNWDCANAILEEMHFDMNQIHACVGNIGDWHDVDFMEVGFHLIKHQRGSQLSWFFRGQ